MGKDEREKFRQELISFIAQKGFIWGPTPEIYGGLAGFYTYAPLGKLLKNNVENAIRDTFVKNAFWEMECPTVLPKKVWEASGHLGNFTDPLIVCKKCKGNFRADELIEDTYPGINTADMSPEDLLTVIKEKDMRCPVCKSEFEMKIKTHNLMMKTTVGLDVEAYNRPETATTTYLPFQRYLTFFRDKLPFGVFQIGKAFRNEISPRKHVLRGREFTQAEGQLFIFEKDKNEYTKFDQEKDMILPLWSNALQKDKKEPHLTTLGDAFKTGLFKNKAYAWTVALAFKLFLNMGIPAEKMRLRQHADDEKAFYADDAWDIEVLTNAFGWIECCGVHDRTDYDLKQHEKFSGKKLQARDDQNFAQTPHVLEIAFGTDRPTFCLLDIFYERKDIEAGKSILHIPAKLAPVKVAVVPLVKKDGLAEIGESIYKDLSKEFVTVYDKGGSIGRRYLRNDEGGTPFCVTVDYDTKEDNSVTVRDRDSEAQERVKIDDLKEYLRKKLC